MSERDEVDAIVADIFSRIQGPQGGFFIGDGEHADTKAELFERLRHRLEHGKEAYLILRAFLIEHKQLRKAARP